MKRRLEEAYGGEQYQRLINPKIRKLVEPVIHAEDQVRNQVLQNLISEDGKFPFSTNDILLATTQQTAKVRHLLEMCNAGAPQEHDLMNEMALLYLLIMTKNKGTNDPQGLNSPDTIVIEYAEPQRMLWTRFYRMAKQNATQMFTVCQIEQRFS